MTAFPALFISHGAPNLVLHESPAHDFFASFGEALTKEHGRPKAILVASAHFEMTIPSFSADETPGMLYDFNGFEDELYRKVYPAPGSPELSAIAARLLAQSGFSVQRIAGRGFDHGVWVPLSLLFPQAEIPVVQMAIVPHQGAGYHIALGRALAPLRSHGVLIIGSGSLTHNLTEIFHGGHAFDAPAEDWVEAFRGWVLTKAEAGALDDIADYRQLAPHAQKNHPTEEHFLPLPFAFGAAGQGAKGKRVHASVERGVMAMDAYMFA